MAMADLVAGLFSFVVCDTTTWSHSATFGKALSSLLFLINFSIYSNSSKTKEQVTIFKICAARPMFWWVHLLALGVIYQAAKKGKKN